MRVCNRLVPSAAFFMLGLPMLAQANTNDSIAAPRSRTASQRMTKSEIPSHNPVDVNRNMKLQKIIRDCRSGIAENCASNFEEYYRGNQDHSSKGGFLGLLKKNAFWGASEELHYTQIVESVEGRDVEFQLGFGYQIASRQSDARMEGKGMVASLPATVSGNRGGTRYWAMIIGLAPEKITDENGSDVENCKIDKLSAESALLCTIDMQPTAVEGYFQDTSARMALALDKWRRKPTQGSDGKSNICPQVINFRWKEPQFGSREIQNNHYKIKYIIDIARKINDKLSEICSTERPNAKLVYRDGTANESWNNENSIENVNISISDGGFSSDRNSVVQWYERPHRYISVSARNLPSHNFIHRNLSDPDKDRSVKISMEGIASNAKLPSILASIVTYERSDISQHLRVTLQCSGGTSGVAGEVNPVANALAYTELVEKARVVVDKGDSTCGPTTANEQSLE